VRDVVGAAFGGRALGGVETAAAPHGAELQPHHSSSLTPQPPARLVLTHGLFLDTHLHHGERQLADHQHRRAGPRQPRQLRPELPHARGRARVDGRRPEQRPANTAAAAGGRQRGSTARRAGKPALRRRRQGQGTSRRHATSPPCPAARTRQLPAKRDGLTGLTIGSLPRDRHRDPAVHTAVGHVADSQPPVRRPGWDRGTGRLDEVHVRRGPC
jgi:hypothetical protein